MKILENKNIGLLLIINIILTLVIGCVVGYGVYIGNMQRERILKSQEESKQYKTEILNQMFKANSISHNIIDGLNTR